MCQEMLTSHYFFVVFKEDEETQVQLERKRKAVSSRTWASTEVQRHYFIDESRCGGMGHDTVRAMCLALGVGQKRYERILNRILSF